MTPIDLKISQKIEQKIDWLGSTPFILMHAACLLVLWIGVSWAALLVCAATLFVRMFGVTAGYHRYFSHRSFETSRWFQFFLAFLGASSTQMGPLWWANHHRTHHRFSDTERDVHSPSVHGLFWAHMGWVMCRKNYEDREKESVSDLKKFPELRFIENYYLIAPLTLAVFVVGLGYGVERFLPGLHTSMWQVTVWGFFVSTVALYHVTFSVNSVAHILGERRFGTKDTSRNNFLFALITMGEGWHNNHHRYPASEKQGFYWWEIDMTHYILKCLSFLGIVWGLKKPPGLVYEEVLHAA